MASRPERTPKLAMVGSYSLIRSSSAPLLFPATSSTSRTSLPVSGSTTPVIGARRSTPFSVAVSSLSPASSPTPIRRLFHTRSATAGPVMSNTPSSSRSINTTPAVRAPPPAASSAVAPPSGTTNTATNALKAAVEASKNGSKGQRGSRPGLLAATAAIATAIPLLIALRRSQSSELDPTNGEHVRPAQMTRGSSDASFFDGHKSDGVEAIRLKFGLSQGAQLRIPPNSSTLAEKNDDDSNTKVQPHPHNASGLTQVPLPTAIGIDIFSALVTAFAVAPGVAIIDKAVISQAAGIDTIGGSVAKCVTDLARNPVKFMRQPNVLVSSVVYLGTFAAANVVEAVCNEMDHPAGMAKFIASSTANMGLSIWKDQAFTRWYSSSAPRALPSSTYTLFALRDGLTMASSFTLPPIVAPIIADALAKHTTTTDSSVLLARAETISQLVLPCAMQLVSTPIHLAALDMYNRPVVAGGMVNRMTTMPFVQNPGDFLKTVGFRCIRILPAFGVGGNLNRSMRSGLRDYYAESRK